MIYKFWNKAKRASILSLLFLLLGLLLNPIFLVLVIFVYVGGLLAGNIKSLEGSLVGNINRETLIKITLLFASTLLAFDYSGGGLGFLIFAIIPIIWVSLTDKKIFEKTSEESSTKSKGEEKIIKEEKEKEEKESNLLNKSSAVEVKPEISSANIISSETDYKNKKLETLKKLDDKFISNTLEENIDETSFLSATFYEVIDTEHEFIKKSDIESIEDFEYESIPERLTSGDYHTHSMNFEGSLNLTYGYGDELLTISEEDLINAGVLEFQKAPNRTPNEPYLEAGRYFLGSEEWSYELCEIRDFDIRKLKIVVRTMTILNVELKIIWEVIYDNKNIELEIEDSGLDCYYYGVQLVDQNKEDNTLLETIYLDDEMTDDNEELNTNIVKWLGSSNKEIKVQEDIPPSNEEDNIQEEINSNSENWDNLDDSEIFQKLIRTEQVSLDVLEKLSNSDDWEIRKAVALNDFATDKILEKLSNDEDGDVKIAVKLNKLPKEWKFAYEDERWGFIDDDLVVEKLMGNKNVDSEILNIFSYSSSDDIKRIVAAHPNTTEETISSFRNADDGVKQAIGYRDLDDEWKYLNKSDIARKIISSEDLDEELLRYFSNSPENVIRGAVAFNSNVPEDILKKLKKESDKYIKECIFYRDLPSEWKSENDFQKVGKIKNTKTIDEGILKILSCSCYDEIRIAVALHPNTNKSILDQFKSDDSDDVKDAISYRNLPDEWKLIDDDEKVEKIKNCEELPPEITKTFINSNNWRIREALIDNDNLELTSIKDLIYDKDPDVNAKAQNKFLPKELKNVHENIKKLDKFKDDISDQLLEVLAGSSNEEIRLYVANCDRTSPAILKGLSKDEDYSVKEAAQKKLLPQEWIDLEIDEIKLKLNEGNVSDEIYEIISESYDWEIRRAVALNDKTPKIFLDKLANDNNNDGYLSEIRDSLIFRQIPNDLKQLEGYELVEKIKEDDSLSQPVLKILAKSNDSSIRSAVAIHPNTSEEDLDKLEFDEDSEVRDSIKLRALPKEWKKLNSREIAEKLNDYEDNGDDYIFKSIDENIFEILGNVEDIDIKLALALQPFTPPEIIKKLDFDGDSDVRDAVLFRSLPDKWTFLDVHEMEERLDDEDYPLIESEVIEILSKTENWNLRAAVARCKYTSSEILKILSFDEDEDVAEAAKKSLRKKGGYIPVEQSGPKEINIKTEPAGKILFGELDSREVDLLKKSIEEKNLCDEIEELKFNSSGDYTEYEGVFSYGEEGDDGNEGIIEYSDLPDSRIEIPSNDDGTYKDGVFFSFMRLSKGSIGFEFKTPDKLEYDSSELTEISIPVDLPSQFTEAHELYGSDISDPFNITIGFKYKGEELDEYDGELIDRGFDDLFVIVEYKDGEGNVLYSNYNGTETWPDAYESDDENEEQKIEKLEENNKEYDGGELEVNTIYNLDIRRITADNYDEEEEFRDYAFLSEFALALAKDSEGNQYSILEFNKFSESAQMFILPTSFPSIDQLEETLLKNEVTKSFLEPLEYQSMARIIYSFLKGRLSLKERENLKDEFNFAQYGRPGDDLNYYPCLFVFKITCDEVKDVVFKENKYTVKYKENYYSANKVEKCDYILDLNTSDIERYLNCVPKDDLFVFEEVEGDTTTIL